MLYYDTINIHFMSAHFPALLGAARAICRIVAVRNRHLQGDVTGWLLLTR